MIIENMGLGALTTLQQKRVDDLLLHLRSNNCLAKLAAGEPEKGSLLSPSAEYTRYRQCEDARNEVRFLEPKWEQLVVAEYGARGLQAEVPIEVQLRLPPQVPGFSIPTNPLAAARGARTMPSQAIETGEVNQGYAPMVAETSGVPVWAWAIGGLAVVGVAVWFGRR